MQQVPVPAPGAAGKSPGHGEYRRQLQRLTFNNQVKWMDMRVKNYLKPRGLVSAKPNVRTVLRELVAGTKIKALNEDGTFAFADDDNSAQRDQMMLTMRGLFNLSAPLSDHVAKNRPPHEIYNFVLSRPWYDADYVAKCFLKQSPMNRAQDFRRAEDARYQVGKPYMRVLVKPSSYTDPADQRQRSERALRPELEIDGFLFAGQYNENLMPKWPEEQEAVKRPTGTNALRFPLGQGQKLAWRFARGPENGVPGLRLRGIQLNSRDHWVIYMLGGNHLDSMRVLLAQALLKANKFFGADRPSSVLLLVNDRMRDSLSRVRRWGETDDRDLVKRVFVRGSSDPPSNALGRDGDTYLYVPSPVYYDVYQKRDGSWVRKDNATVRDGVVQPNDAEHEDGDFHVNTATMAWREKVNGAWVRKDAHSSVPDDAQGIDGDTYVQMTMHVFEKANQVWQRRPGNIRTGTKPTDNVGEGGDYFWDAERNRLFTRTRDASPDNRNGYWVFVKEGENEFLWQDFGFQRVPLTDRRLPRVQVYAKHSTTEKLRRFLLTKAWGSKRGNEDFFNLSQLDIVRAEEDFAKWDRFRREKDSFAGTVVASERKRAKVFYRAVDANPLVAPDVGSEGNPANQHSTARLGDYAVLPNGAVRRLLLQDNPAGGPGAPPTKQWVAVRAPNTLRAAKGLPPLLALFRYLDDEGMLQFRERQEIFDITSGADRVDFLADRYPQDATIQRLTAAINEYENDDVTYFYSTDRRELYRLDVLPDQQTIRWTDVVFESFRQYNDTVNERYRVYPVRGFRRGLPEQGNANEYWVDANDVLHAFDVRDDGAWADISERVGDGTRVVDLVGNTVYTMEEDGVWAFQGDVVTASALRHPSQPQSLPLLNDDNQWFYSVASRGDGFGLLYFRNSADDPWYEIVQEDKREVYETMGIALQEEVFDYEGEWSLNDSGNWPSPMQFEYENIVLEDHRQLRNDWAKWEVWELSRTPREHGMLSGPNRGGDFRGRTVAVEAENRFLHTEDVARLFPANDYHSRGAFRRCFSLNNGWGVFENNEFGRRPLTRREDQQNSERVGVLGPEQDDATQEGALCERRYLGYSVKSGLFGRHAANWDTWQAHKSGALYAWDPLRVDFSGQDHFRGLGDIDGQLYSDDELRKTHMDEMLRGDGGQDFKNAKFIEAADRSFAPSGEHLARLRSRSSRLRRLGGALPMRDFRSLSMPQSSFQPGLRAGRKAGDTDVARNPFVGPRDNAPVAGGFGEQGEERYGGDGLGLDGYDGDDSDGESESDDGSVVYDEWLCDRDGIVGFALRPGDGAIDYPPDFPLQNPLAYFTGQPDQRLGVNQNKTVALGGENLAALAEPPREALRTEFGSFGSSRQSGVNPRYVTRLQDPVFQLEYGGKLLTDSYDDELELGIDVEPFKQLLFRGCIASLEKVPSRDRVTQGMQSSLWVTGRSNLDDASVVLSQRFKQPSFEMLVLHDNETVQNMVAANMRVPVTNVRGWVGIRKGRFDDNVNGWKIASSNGNNPAPLFDSAEDRHFAVLDSLCALSRTLDEDQPADTSSPFSILLFGAMTVVGERWILAYAYTSRVNVFVECFAAKGFRPLLRLPADRAENSSAWDTFFDPRQKFKQAFQNLDIDDTDAVKVALEVYVGTDVAGDFYVVEIQEGKDRPGLWAMLENPNTNPAF